jgi:hypothetical protein
MVGLTLLCVTVSALGYRKTYRVKRIRHVKERFH